jgi:hypothetical protein
MGWEQTNKSVKYKGRCIQYIPYLGYWKIVLGQNPGGSDTYLVIDFPSLKKAKAFITTKGVHT